MASLLQYNFFPTDFYFPRPTPVSDQQQVLPVQTQGHDTTAASEDPKSLVFRNMQNKKNKIVKFYDDGFLVGYTVGSLMAGLQYNFFPTDFYYPRPRGVNRENTGQQVLHVKTQKGDETDASKHSTSLVSRVIIDDNKARKGLHSSSSSIFKESQGNL
ncbi:hypothetical protein RJ640_027632 [Escallonia rubra]|uniref:Uncharacterized protein n=1 Tax=Escallonia rubra TaxID=112253 RepID=A0AA88RJ79_9ASTE|nr:hypothetical protein RJ640_027632 [Escallonia rubra]